MPSRLSVYLQYLVPQHLFTRGMGWLADVRHRRLKNWMIQRFIQKYRVDMSHAQLEQADDYQTFNQFFIRKLKPLLRPIASGAKEIACPVDGTVAQIGSIRKNQLLQAKGQYFNLESLLGGDSQLANRFQDGAYATLYLAPNNYHRVHMPIAGNLTQTIFIPGQLFSVNNMTSTLVPNLYCRNERLITVFDTEAGPMAVILVGAMIVGSIQTTWMQQPIKSQQLVVENNPPHTKLAHGAEMGHFKLGSTVILLFAKDKIQWDERLQANMAIQFGQKIGLIA